MDELAEKIREAQRKTCRHKCHTVGLNPWVESCPICGCPNPNYQPKDKDELHVRVETPALKRGR